MSTILLILACLISNLFTIPVVSYTTYPSRITMYRGEIENKNMLFAMNGGMYLPDHSPVGLYIESGKTIKKLNRGSSGNWQYGNNGVFWISKNGQAGISRSKEFFEFNMVYATQSGPILVKDGIVQPLNKTSKFIRNGIGILPNGGILMALTKEEVSLHDFAQYFKQMGCMNALYLDGAVSEAYYPGQGLTECYGKFGVIIGVKK